MKSLQKLLERVRRRNAPMGNKKNYAIFPRSTVKVTCVPRRVRTKQPTPEPNPIDTIHIA